MYADREFEEVALDGMRRTIAARLSATLRRGDTLARLGGDEFTVLLPDINQPEDAEIIARKVLEALSPPIGLSQGQFRATVSVGIALFPRDGSSAEELTRHADVAMYQVKRSGKNAYRFWNRYAQHVLKYDRSCSGIDRGMRDRAVCDHKRQHNTIYETLTCVCSTDGGAEKFVVGGRLR